MNPQVIIPSEAIRDFCRAHSVRELAVFGSAVRPDFSQDSDIDILNWLPARTGINFQPLALFTPAEPLRCQGVEQSGR